MGYKEGFIELMVRSGVLTFGDFTTKSGRKILASRRAKGRARLSY